MVEQTSTSVKDLALATAEVLQDSVAPLLVTVKLDVKLPSAIAQTHRFLQTALAVGLINTSATDLASVTAVAPQVTAVRQQAIVLRVAKALLEHVLPPTPHQTELAEDPRGMYARALASVTAAT